MDSHWCYLFMLVTLYGDEDSRSQYVLDMLTCFTYHTGVSRHTSASEGVDVVRASGTVFTG